MRTSALSVLLLVLSAGLAGAQVPTSERDALIAFFISTNGGGWAESTGWIGAVGTECSWLGVDCSGGHVTALRLRGNDVSGSIPPEIGDLPFLQMLALGPLWTYQNRIEGTIPLAIWTLTDLRHLDLSSNQLTGDVPADVANLSMLQVLLLGANQLIIGELPQVWGFTALEELDLSSCQLQGTIPPQIGALTNLEYLDLSSNQVHGTIPAEIGSLTALDYLYLQDNQLEGSIPTAIGNPSFASLDLSQNQLTGLLPLSLSVEYSLNLSHNQISGSLPTELGNLLPTLRELRLSFNQLSGSIPEQLGNMVFLNIMDLDNNRLSGEIPSQLGGLENLSRLRLDHNQLSGSLPATFGDDLDSLSILNLRSNRLSGPIPPGIANNRLLASLYMDHNQFSGEIPPEFGNLKCRDIDLSNNQLSGEIPAELGSLDHIENLDLSFNRLSGNIPNELGALRNLQTLGLAGNGLSGEIPWQLSIVHSMTDGGSDISFNALWTDSPTVQRFFDAKAPGWRETQTVPPEGLRVTTVGDRTIWLEWQPISYVADEGGYTVFCDQLGARAGEIKGATPGKDVTTFPVTDVDPDQIYTLTVSTLTLPHALNLNTLSSEESEPAFAVTAPGGCATPQVSVTDHGGTATLEVTNVHDSYEWVTGETTASITVSPARDTWYWVRAFGPGGCDEAAAVLVAVPVFSDGFESGDTSGWSGSVPAAP